MLNCICSLMQILINEIVFISDCFESISNFKRTHEPILKKLNFRQHTIAGMQT